MVHHKYINDTDIVKQDNGSVHTYVRLSFDIGTKYQRSKILYYYNFYCSRYSLERKDGSEFDWYQSIFIFEVWERRTGEIVRVNYEWKGLNTLISYGYDTEF